MDPVSDPLAQFERKMQVVRDQTTGVAYGYCSGYFLHGTGGVGKSYTVIRQLEKLGRPYHLFNSRMTGKGLFMALEHAPDAVHVLEDMERLTKDADAQGVLRSALWAQPGHDRIVTWTTASEGVRKFVFRGGVIMISNRPLADMPELRALATRIEVHKLDVSDAEITALMRVLASRGYHRSEKLVIPADECIRITEHFLKECRVKGCPLDLRLQQKCYQTYLQWEADHTVCHWEDLVAASVREAAHHFRHDADTSPREERRTWRRSVLREILRETADVGHQELLYKERTGASRADFFRRKREIESGEFDPESPNPV